MRIVRTLLSAGALAMCCALASSAAAESDASEDGQGLGQNTAERSAASGVFLRFTDSPALSGHKVAVDTHVGADTNRRGATIETRGEAVLFTRRSFGLAVMGGGAYVGAARGIPESSNAFGGVKLQALSQALHGVDAGFSVSYASRGFNLKPAVVSELLLGRRFGEAQLILNVGYGAGLEENERFGTARAALLGRVVKELRLGVDGRFMADLELDSQEPENEPEFEANAGAVVSYTISHISVSASAGPAALRYRDGNETLVGALVSIGVGATL